MTFNEVPLTFVLFIICSLHSCDGDAKIVEMQSYDIKIDTIYKYKVEVKGGKSDVITSNRKLEKNDVIDYGW